MLTNPETGSDEAPTRKIVDFQLTFVVSVTWSVVSTKLVIESIPGMVEVRPSHLYGVLHWICKTRWQTAVGADTDQQKVELAWTENPLVG